MDPLRAHAAHGAAAAGPGSSSIDTSDELALTEPPRYCPMGLLASFTLLMAGHGRCVHTDMMLGDREYAMWQLACARAADDPELDEVARRLFAYFDDAQHTGMAVMGTA